MSDFRQQIQLSLGTGYSIDREIGGGGMSRVFVARDASLRRDVVVKVLPPDLVAGVNLERFRREILVAAGLQHPHIVPVLSAGDADGLPWFTMPFVEGESLRARLARGPLSVAETVGLLREVAKALAYAHERGVVHRDIKPDNVLLSGGTAVVTDFGIAKALAAALGGGERPERDSAKDPSIGALTALGTSIGTPAYMAPEQAAGDPATDARADIYSFGCLAYELLTGRPPFTDKSPQKLLAAHMAERPQLVSELRRDTPPLLSDLVAHCLEKDPNQRPGGAADLVRLLDAVSTTSGDRAAASAVLLGGRVRLRVALALWALVFGAAWIFAKAAIVAIGLPAWVLPGALIVAALGLPVILLTAFVQRVAHRELTRTPTLTPGGTNASVSTLATMALKASPHVSWKRTTRGGIVAFGAFVLMVAVFMGMRALGIGPAGSLLGAGVIANRDQLLVADFSIAGADSLLARAVTEAIRTDLGQSDVLRLVPSSAVNQMLALMQKPPGTRIDTGTARVIAVRSGVKAVLGGDITPLGTSYLLTARLIAPATGDVLAAFRETAADQRDLVPAVERLSRALRAKVGESLRRIHADPPLTQVTTSSLDALRLYAQGLHVGDDLGNVPAGMAILLRAVQLDSTFAMGWRKLGTWANNAGDMRAEVFAKRAADNAAHLPPAERLLAIGSYQTTNGDGYDPVGAVASYTSVIDADSGDANTTVVTAMVNAAIQLSSLGQLDSAIVLGRRAAPLNTYALYHLSQFEGEAGHARASDSIAAIAHVRAPTFPYRALFDITRLSMLRRYDSAASAGVPVGPSEIMGHTELAHVQMALGRLADARKSLRLARDSLLAHGDTGLALDRLATESLIESVVRGQPATAAALLEDGTKRLPISAKPVSHRPYYQLAAAWAAAGRADRAAQLIEEGDRTYSRGSALWNREPRMIAVGSLALLRGKPADAVATLKEPAHCGGSSPRNYGASLLVRCPQPFLAEAYDRAGDRDASRVAYERFVNTPTAAGLITEGPMLAQSLQRLGELYEEKGDRQAAAKYYGRLLELWKSADPELRPRVEDIRKRLSRLSDSERK